MATDSYELKTTLENIKTKQQSQDKLACLFDTPYPCGILPFAIKDGQIVWGLVRTNRIGPSVVVPPSGARDLLVKAQGKEYRIELEKPLPEDIAIELGLTKWSKQSVKGGVYLEIVECLHIQGHEAYLESPLKTACNETAEEHGLDILGANFQLLKTLFELPPQTLEAKRGTVTQLLWVAYLSGVDGVNLQKHQNKKEAKIECTKGSTFFEEGCWGTLEQFSKELKELQEQSLQNADLSFNREGLVILNSEEHKKMIQAELKVTKSRLLLVARAELAIIEYLRALDIQVHSSAGGIIAQLAPSSVQLEPLKLTNVMTTLEGLRPANPAPILMSQVQSSLATKNNIFA